MKRSSGILMPISSLPSKYGIGTLGKQAFQFADFLHEAGQRYWQLLPIGPTSYGDSPYSSFSTFAGNPYFIDLAQLAKEGLLSRTELDAADWGKDPRAVDYGKIYELRFTFLKKAFDAGHERDAGAVKRFRAEQADWLEDYALFMALKRHFGMISWTEWPDEQARLHKPEAIAHYAQLLREEVELFVYIQFLFFRQWRALKRYLEKRDILVIGDIPIYVAMDSADVWASPSGFLIDEQGHPTEVSGVPPDYFNADGQLWGNPLYDWAGMKEDGYSWWMRRIEGASRMYDVIRIDHFRGLESYWAVPFGEKTARKGTWQPGPGLDFIHALRKSFPDLPIIAEDLGFLTPEVRALLEASGYPGMKVLEFAFDSREPSNYLPHTYSPNCICYIGTHDNTTVMGWREEASRDDLALAVRYLGLSRREGFNWGIIRGGMSSVANLFVTQMQDYLGLGAEARINIPGTSTGNWTWRMRKGEAGSKLAKRIRRCTRMYGRMDWKDAKSV